MRENHFQPFFRSNLRVDASNNCGDYALAFQKPHNQTKSSGQYNLCDIFLGAFPYGHNSDTYLPLNIR